MIKCRVRLPKALWNRIEKVGDRDAVVSALVEMLFDYDMFENMPPSALQFKKDVVSHIIFLSCKEYEEWLSSHDAREPTHSLARAIVYSVESGFLSEPDLIERIGEK